MRTSGPRRNPAVRTNRGGTLRRVMPVVLPLVLSLALTVSPMENFELHLDIRWTSDSGHGGAQDTVPHIVSHRPAPAGPHRHARVPHSGRHQHAEVVHDFRACRR